MPRFKSFATLCSSSFSTAEKRLSRSVDASSLGAFLTAFFEEQAPIRTAARHEPFLLKFVI